MESPQLSDRSPSSSSGGGGVYGEDEDGLLPREGEEEDPVLAVLSEYEQAMSILSHQFVSQKQLLRCVKEERDRAQDQLRELQIHNDGLLSENASLKEKLQNVASIVHEGHHNHTLALLELQNECMTLEEENRMLLRQQSQDS